MTNDKCTNDKGMTKTKWTTGGKLSIRRDELGCGRCEGEFLDVGETAACEGGPINGVGFVFAG